MNTSTDGINRLQQALKETNSAVEIINNLIVEHDYQDVASLVAQAAASLLESASLLLQSQDEAALDAIERADDFLEAVYDIIEAETDED
jgi:hypothetical protein